MILDQARAILTQAFAPLPADRFFDEIMGRTVFHLPGDAAHPRCGLLGAEPRQAILDAFATHSDKLGWHAAAPTGAAPPAFAAATPEAFRASIAAFHARGYTVRVPDVTALDPALALLARALEFMLHQPVKAAAFWSTQDARAPFHYDDNDNLVIQLVGRKTWTVSSERPSLHNAWRDVAEVPPTLGAHHAIDLGPGDMLYVPRGTPHSVHSRSESLHLAVLFTPVTLRDVMIAAIDHLSDHERALRESALGRIDAPVDLERLSRGVGQALGHLAQAARSGSFLHDALQRRASRAIGTMTPLAGAPPAAPLTPSTAVRHNPLAMAHMIATPNAIDFCQPGGHINIHRGVESALRYLRDTPAFRISDLPGDLPDEVRVALVERLIGSGFLQRDG